ncbi:hypothetical protein C5748_16280 [Phyllobacterium phragmitis]|uniref:Phosphohydrolase n=1 Tax=Phyllobacterium phragmitis TaxID=2670329 RepID=A0A2S9IPA6_9HYPH|nr:hypothetical protein [Phyllobacterium phragmitis]PRD42350.1 hypothetical protein C5748_16280 [Phyllobacterium phragmitis]
MTAFVPAFRPDGTVLNLAEPQTSDIVWPEIANSLSKIARFNGRYSCPAYVVAQHCVMGADAIFNETGDAIAAGYFLLHDAREVFIGDMIRPMQRLLSLHLDTYLEPELSVRLCIDRIGWKIDAAIFKAARLPHLTTMPDYQHVVDAMDDRMLRAETIAFFGQHAAEHVPAADLPAPKLTGALKPWGPMKAEEAWLARLSRYLGIDARAGVPASDRRELKGGANNGGSA